MGERARNGRSVIPQEALEELLAVVRAVREVPGDIVEAGCYRCGTTVEMAREAPGKVVYGFDTFGGLPYGDEQKLFRNFADADWEEVLSYTAAYPNIRLIRGKHEETVPKFEARPLALVFMDSDHDGSFAVCLEHFKSMLSVGAAVVLDDMSFDGLRGIARRIFGTDENYESCSLPSGLVVARRRA